MSKPLHPATAKAQGYLWLLRVMKGEGVINIAKKDHREPKTVRKYVREAAKIIVDETEELILKELIPKAIEVYKAALDHQLVKAQAGQPVDTKDAERLLKGINIFDRPFEKKISEDSDPEDLETFLITRRKTVPAIEATVEKVKALDAAPSERRQPEDNPKQG